MRQPNRKAEILSLGTAAYVKQCFRRRLFESTIGIKILYYQVEHRYGQRWGVSGLPNVLELLKSQQDIKIVHLKRRNYLKTLASIRFASLTKKYAVREQTKTVDNFSIELTADECEHEFSRIRQWERLYDDIFKDHKILEIYYEILVTEQGRECDRILDFLSVPRRTLTTGLKKLRKRPLSEVVKNYYELKRYFSRTEWARFFK